MVDISCLSCPKCGAPIRNGVKNQFCQHCGAGLLNDSINSDDPIQDIGTTYLESNVSEDLFIKKIKKALNTSRYVFRDYVDLVAKTERQLVYVPIVLCKYDYFNGEWTGEISVKQSSGRFITFPSSGRVRGSITYPIVNATISTLPFMPFILLKIISEDDVSGSHSPRSNIRVMQEAYNKTDLLKDHNDRIKKKVLHDAERKVTGTVESFSLSWNYKIAYNTIYTSFWISYGDLNKIRYFFIMNAHNGKTYHSTRDIETYYSHHSYKPFRNLCLIVSIMWLVLPGIETEWFYLLIIGLIAPKLSKGIPLMLNKIQQHSRIIRTANILQRLDAIFQKVITPLIYVITIIGIILKTYFEFS